jgi:hypothetical protein
LVPAGLLFLGFIWFNYSADPKIAGLRNIVQYRVVKAMGGPHVHTGEPPGAIAGTIRNAEREPVAGALVLVASPLGDSLRNPAVKRKRVLSASF